jgi:hypothetical protein
VKWKYIAAQVPNFATASMTFKAPISMGLLKSIAVCLLILKYIHLYFECFLIERFRNENREYVKVLESLSKQLVWLLELIELLKLANSNPPNGGCLF